MKKISYNPLWKTLIDKGIKNKTELIEMTGISSGTLAKMSKNEYVSLEIIDNICLFLGCKIEDVVKIEHDKKS